MTLENLNKIVESFNKNNFDFPEIDEQVRDMFNILTDKRVIKLQKNGKIKKLQYENIHVGILEVKNKFGFIYSNGEDYYVHKTLGYLNGDLVVCIERPEFKGSSTEVEILGVLKREAQKTICRVSRSKKLISLDKKYENHLIEFVDPKELDEVNEKQIIQVSIVDVVDYTLKVEFVSLIADKNDPDVQMKVVLANYDIETNFSEETLKEVEDIEEPTTKDLEGRTDLTNELIMTIDGADSKDLDDAVHMYKEGENYRLTVSIADVSHYIKENTALDIDAYSRATSVYFVDRVVPMIPKKLSNGICSLHPNVNRLTISCEMLIDSNGDVIDSKIYPSYINSKYRLTYTQVNEMIHENKVEDELKPIYGTIKEMDKLREILNKKRIKRGAFNLEDKDAKFSVDEEGNITDIKPVVRQNGEKLIEEFMIVANETVAQTIYYMELPFIYRVHDQPNIKKLKDVLEAFKLFNIHVKGDIYEFKPMMFKSALDQIDEPISRRILSDIIVRSLSKAKYQEANIGHFGLASKNYTHFTSPIRRYPDLIVHRLLRKYLFEGDVNYNSESIEKLKEIGGYTSEKEVKAIKAEQEIEDMKKASYMAQFVGQDFNAVVAGVTDFGFFIELENTVRSLIKFRNIEEFKRMNKHVIYFNNDTQLTLGDSVKVHLDEAKEQEGLLEFSLVDYTKKEVVKRSYKTKQKLNKTSSKDKKPKTRNSSKDKKPQNINSKKRRRKKYSNNKGRS